MPDKPFVINDRRRFTAEGEVRPDAPPIEHTPKPESENNPEAATPEMKAESTSAATHGKEAGPRLVSMPSSPQGSGSESPQRSGNESSQPVEDTVSGSADPAYPPPPTPEQLEQAAKAYEATIDRLDTAIRAQNLGAEQPPPMSFERFIQSLYMQAILQLGGATEPGQPPQLDILGARQSIDMLTLVAAKSKGNLSEGEAKLLEIALFEARMAFLEITQALARQAAARAGNPDTMPPPPGGGPSIVR